jgi:hypothetical protein
MLSLQHLFIEHLSVRARRFFILSLRPCHLALSHAIGPEILRAKLPSHICNQLSIRDHESW